MKKFFTILLLSMLPILAFSEVVFSPRIGFDIHKALKNKMMDNVLKNIVNKAIESGKSEGENPTLLEDDAIPHSDFLLTMFTIGLDMQFIAHSNGFTFFWNNEFSYAKSFKAYEQFHFVKQVAPLKDIMMNEDGTFNENQKTMLYSTELMFGGTFRRENDFNIHFGLGLKLGFTPSTLKLIKPAISGDRAKIPDEIGVIVLPAIGGTFGFTYYFNKVVGLSASVNEFLGFGAFLSAKVTGRDPAGVANKGIAYASIGFSNNFAMKLGVNLRVNGVRNSGL